MKFFEYIENSFDELIALEDTLCRIPAPSWKEQFRAAYVEEWLRPYGAVHTDAADNVVFTGFDRGEGPVTIFIAHTDTVFPDLTPFTPEVRDGRLYCPGAGDDTANLAALMLLVKYLSLTGAEPKGSVIFAANSGEEGLGNLRGVRQLVETYGDRLEALVSLDGGYYGICDDAVGSHRYRVTVKTKGGHSYSNFGRRNAIHALSELITELYRVEVPTKAKTTFNTGSIEGGTSVNTIAQEASMLYEYRSSDRECLEYMKKFFEETVARANEDPEVQVSVEVLGIRPCRGDVPAEAQQKLVNTITDAILTVLPGIELGYGAGSTDCNIPLSLGIPAACFGFYTGQGAHTREEYIELDSLLPGIRIGAELMRRYFKTNG